MNLLFSKIITFNEFKQKIDWFDMSQMFDFQGRGIKLKKLINPNILFINFRNILAHVIVLFNY